jgi:hypothetical protein
MKKIIAATLLGLAACSSLHAQSATLTNKDYFAFTSGLSHLSSPASNVNASYSATLGLAYGKRYNELGFEISCNTLGFNTYSSLTISSLNADLNYYHNLKKDISIKGIVGLGYVLSTYDRLTLAAKIGIGGQFVMTENLDFVTSLNFLKTLPNNAFVDNMLYLSAGIAF